MEINYEGWIKATAITGAVVAMECWGERSVTNHVHKAMEHPIGRWVVPLAVANIAMHLVDKEHNILPENADIIQWLARGIDRVRND